MPNEVSAQIQELTTQFIRKTTVATKYVRLFAHTVEPPKMDSPYYGNLHNADKSLQSRIIPCTIVYVHKETSVLRTPPK